ncbi:hypothetical protein AWC38_SpisGene24191 [Stylophora pistillata]|uniref:SWIM-type domain-containing protein n=1 Tax=Stylophora pistillata TaxID=50429 RepID=A0A2B4R6B6_STYPI|nr:hypothetical protein AWC38_SpisGene24191 [Stylophora pistillata]
MKAYKALDAYNFFVSGWVNTVFTKKVAESNSVVVTARVYHLQRTRTTPLSTWLLADVSGEVILGHCDCMAGLCEACSHIAALLVAVEAGYRMRDSVTCTGEKGQWIMPSYVKEIPYMPVSDMDLTSANKLRKQLEEPDGSKQRAEKKRPQIEVTTASERDNFFKEIFNYGKSAILSLTPPYNSSFIFHEEQVFVDSKNRDSLRFLCWPNEDLTKEMKEYPMVTHLFGATSSPSVANFYLRKTAQSYQEDFYKEVIETVNRNMYVDDMMKSTSTTGKAISLASQLRTLLEKGGFRLTKWYRKDREVMGTIPKSERAKSVANLELEGLPTESALGLKWNIEEDKFVKEVMEKMLQRVSQKPVTR